MTSLTDEMKADGWVEHDGAGIPVAPESRVAVIQRTGLPRDVRKASHWCARETEPEWGPDCWKHTGHWSDIITPKPEQDHANR